MKKILIPDDLITITYAAKLRGCSRQNLFELAARHLKVYTIDIYKFVSQSQLNKLPKTRIKKN